MCFFGGGGGGAQGPQSSADKNNSGAVPVQPVVNKAVQNQNTADRNTMRRAGQTSAVASGQKTMNALNDYNKANKKTILGS